MAHHGAHAYSDSEDDNDDSCNSIEKGDAVEPRAPGPVPDPAQEFEVEDTNTESPPPDSITFRKLLSLGDGVDVLLMIFGTLGGLAHGLLFPTAFVVFASSFRSFGDHPNDTSALADSLAKISDTFLLLSLGQLVSVFFEQGCWLYTGERQASRMRRKFVEGILRQDVGYFDTEANTARLMSIISTDIGVAQDAIEKVGHCVSFTTTFWASFVLALYYCWELGLLTLLVVPLIATTGGLYNAAVVNISKQSQEAYVEADSIAEQTISQIRTVYSYVGEMRAVDAFSVALEKTLKLGEKAGFAKGLGLGSMNGVMNMSWGLLFWLASVLVIARKADPSNAIIAMFCIIFGGVCLGMAAPDFQAFAQGQLAGKRVFDILERQPTVADRRECIVPSSKMAGGIELRQVYFAYPSRPDAQIFKGLSLDIPQGRSMALVGGSGSGKSTVISLIERFYDPDQGQLLIDGYDIKDLKMQWLRSQIGLVGQEPALFGTTIRENILLGRAGATMVDIESAAKAANAHSFITDLPLQYETQVGDRGTQLSGGQKQRLAIARAVLKNPAILLLDEATSALDADSEQVVQEALDSLLIGRTSVIVAHRLSTIKNADCISVLSKGEIVEMGTHNELMSRGERGAYFSLVKLQGGGDVARKAGKPMGSNTPKASPVSNRNSMTSPLHLALGGLSPAMSPMLSPAQASFASFDVREQTNNAETESPGNADYQRSRSTSAFKRLVTLSRPQWKDLIVGAIGSLGSGCVTPLFAYIMTNAAMGLYGSDHHVKKTVDFWAIIFVVLGSGSVFFNVVQHSFFMKAGEQVTKTMREETFAAIVENEVGWFDREENSSTAIAARLSTDAANVKATVGEHTPAFTDNIAGFFAAIVLAATSDWRMTLVGLVLMPLVLVAGVMLIKSMAGFSGELKKSHVKANKLAGEAVTNIKTVASFTAEAQIIEQLNQALEEPLKKGFREGMKHGFLYGASQAACQLSNALGLFFAASSIRRGHSTFRGAFRAFQVIQHTSNALTQVLAIVPSTVKAGEAISSLFDIIDRPTEIEPDSEDSKKPSEIKGFIEFRAVDFTYPSRPDVQILSNFSLKIAAGKTVALVGPSGSGKSSVIALIERFYDPQGGHILIDGKDLRYINLRSLRQRIALVQQEPALFGCSIRENILYGSEDASEQEVMAAARAAHAHNFISSLPAGYDTDVGDRGSQLSGGQKQRIAIARAILKNPSILLLDEATSALDLESERIVQEALDKLMREGSRTTIVVAHRLSTVRDANVIAFLNGGVITEKGDHISLVQRRGAYASLVASQQVGSQSSSQH